MNSRPQATASTPAPLLGRGRNRKQTELQHLNNEIQLLQEELEVLNNTPLASKACKDLITFVENLPDPFLSSSDGVGHQPWPYDRPSKSRRHWWKF
ncbi:guanine nucleotide-binding protein subunit gamma 2 [Physcomitrium patens]|uniref:G protein gamma domain-containing protein n=1 Tax=Physcomitrium patens TaxID=3218 RepID=A0A2K1JT01_PHYPA|nr:guanine nucleotide-binding protein subunit gamma 2-like [Physcomitrium patens]XP_024388999.1 guanine nucleotide-binding protein subunit gamma 2-like [Physcomitrium patens]XP_024389000.1 guanine nucleotide-binding protein subunit gamma 2-like [Physcomitrium patens]PNR44657.1 hypothetical protein PHYPA_014426 [Physcomitrium patens]|eukprot:XP_024388998.1 guanine nucleotide-binding protein subunit gamma 2-like [Physcomitrella patens]